MGRITRREFVAAVPGIGVAAALTGLPAGTALGTAPPTRDGAVWPGFPRQDQTWVKEMVVACHFNLDGVRELLDEHPSLVNAAWDWGFGDWETGLGAASHTGRRTIAELLIERGARIDIFAATMLGQTDTVKALLAANPGTQRTAGPHGITLLAHARAGGKRATETLAFLKSLGDAVSEPTVERLARKEQRKYIGKYACAALGDGVLEIKRRKGYLSIGVHGQTARGLRHLANHTFHPIGAPKVRIQFEGTAPLMAAVTIIDHRKVLTATRVP